MAEQEKLALAKETFVTLCKALDNNDYKYHRNDEKLSVEFGVRGDDIPMDFIIKVDVQRQFVMILSPVNVSTDEDKRLDMAVAISIINNKIVNGSFDFDISTGKMYFRMVNSFIDSELGEELFTYMIFSAASIIDDYNDKFYMLSKGIISLEQFIDSEQSQ